MSSKGIHEETFGNKVRELVRASGRLQQELAGVLNLHPKVLSRKLHGNGNAHVTHVEIRTIITELARWHALATQDEAVHLLDLAQVGAGIFDEQEWKTPPLNQLQARRASSTFSPKASASTSPLHNLPAPTTRFVGREWAVERLRLLFEQDDVRLISLVGVGGSGKTRLALHVAQTLLGNFEHGVWFISLAAVHDPAFVPMSIVQGLNIQITPGIPVLHSLHRYLRDKQLLLVLDNFEQVSEAATLVDELLTIAPRLRVLVTSRAILRLNGEHTLGVPTLDIPLPDTHLSASELLHYEAVQLFVERVQSFVPDFTLTEQNKSIVIKLCRKLEGLPLALELAAARMRVLSPEMLLERLSDALLDVLTGGARNVPARQRTLRNTIVWSYNLLPVEEQEWFSRFSMFSGGWSLEAAEAMQSYSSKQSTDPSSMLDLIERLVDNSLLVRIAGVQHQPRFTMLEMLREYARELLAQQRDFEQWQDWHACYYLHLAETAEMGLRGSTQLLWLEQCKIERDNIRAALQWLQQRAKAGLTIHLPTFTASTEHTEAVSYRDVAGSCTLSSHPSPSTGRMAIELYLRLASALRPYWEWQGYLMEARDWLKDALSIAIEHLHEPTVLAARAKALGDMSRLLSLQNEQERAADLAEESLTCWRQLDDPVGIATALLQRGWAAQALDKNDEACTMYEEALHALERTHDTWLRAQLLMYMAAAAGFTYHFEDMRSFYHQSRTLFEQLDDTSALADVLKDQGGMLLLESKYEESIQSLLRSIALCQKLDQRQYITTGLGWLSIAIGLRSKPDPETASLYTAQLQGATHSLMDSIGLTSWASTDTRVQTVLQFLRSRVSEQRWQDAWNEGRTLTMEQAIQLAFRLGQHPGESGGGVIE